MRPDESLHATLNSVLAYGPFAGFPKPENLLITKGQASGFSLPKPEKVLKIRHL
jgi:hypothetical protein